MLTNMGDVGLKDGWKPSTKKREAKPRLVSQPVHNGKAEPIPLPLPPPPKLPVPTTADSPMQNPAYSGKAPSAEQSLTTLVQDAALMPPWSVDSSFLISCE